MVQLELSPEVEKQLQSAAEARGLTPEAHASQIVASAVARVAEKRVTPEDLERFFAEMAAIGQGASPLPESALTRESFYQDHD